MLGAEEDLGGAVVLGHHLLRHGGALHGGRQRRRHGDGDDVQRLDDDGFGRNLVDGGGRERDYK